MSKSQKYKPESKPGFWDYKNMDHEIRPHVMFTNSENYTTKSVNTDRLGFRKTFFNNKLVGLDELKSVSDKQNIIVGGSTAFSMGSESDETAIHSLLNKENSLWFSLGVRGATSRQELHTFLSLKNFFSKIENLVIFSGLNDLALCSDKNSFYYQDFGGIVGASHERFHVGFLQSVSFFNSKFIQGKANLIHLIYYLSNKSKIFKFIIENLFSKIKLSKIQKKTKNISQSLNFENKLKNIKKINENDLEIWSSLSKQFNFNIIYLFQPAITWTKRQPTSNEEEIKSEVLKRINQYFDVDFSKFEVYLNYKNFIQKVCEKNSIEFYDSNELIVNANKDEDIFIDFAHLTTYGNKFIAKEISKLLHT